MSSNRAAWVIALLPLAAAVYAGCGSSSGGGNGFTGDDAAFEGSTGDDGSSGNHDTGTATDSASSNGG